MKGNPPFMYWRRLFGIGNEPVIFIALPDFDFSAKQKPKKYHSPFVPMQRRVIKQP